MIDRNKKSKCKLKKDLYLKIEEERKTKSERGRVKTGKVKRAFVVEREACVERDRTLKPTGLILEKDWEVTVGRETTVKEETKQKQTERDMESNPSVERKRPVLNDRDINKRKRKVKE